MFGAPEQAEGDRWEHDYRQQAGATVGRFSSSSAWPVVMALGVATALEGFVYGIWLFVPGVALFIGAVVGLVAESRG